MERNTLDWSLLRSFLAVIQTGSLSGAAATLQLTQPTLGRHIDQLEEQLGAVLFTRSRMGLQPTDQARALVPHAEAMAAASAALLRTAKGTGPETRGTVRLTASEIMGTEVLPPMIAAFRMAHPGIEIELQLSDIQQDMLRRDADIALRMVRPSQTQLIARKLGVAHVHLYATREFLSRHGEPTCFEDLRTLPIIGYDANLRAIEYMRRENLEITRDIFTVRCDSEPGQLALLRAGAGIGGCQVGIARRNSELQPVLPDLVGFPMEMWLATHEDLRNDPRVRALFDFLSIGLQEYAAENTLAP